ncbi:MarR family winged helix-turn-helix transcriptional regulator [Hymenobacter chitinivorans]|uniref:DNA-binding MarR family transcriptional regulator n=1 Tax=Hymenobacter chitinivorans DSM 11115 TaxID=1121954 RepID=A0A2M9BQF0_9BACT|nr:MarR family transcriptional regulator [Hymenobacter chitinivorans]PJJ60183.1 DNA-binding MarR family transcriptional regulator [Hymenobacter chitinivorans DSM 11115]
MLSNVLFYSLDKAIKQYRRFAQANIDRAGIAITIDQWLVLRVILENDDLTQTEIGDRVFKDQASVARIIRLLTQRELLAAEALAYDGRRTQLRVTEEGQRILDAVQPIVLNNRGIALQGLSDADTAVLQTLLERIYRNCTPTS